MTASISLTRSLCSMSSEPSASRAAEPRTQAAFARQSPSVRSLSTSRAATAPAHGTPRAAVSTSS
ncbi:hypothetical protein [Streptomyces sp. NPDC056660]|uniref:hypothetical protein n=1 Tax=Streptomyces sp. NPDC056660 TaxID=3345897 RepID=UPI0036CF5CA3